MNKFLIHAAIGLSLMGVAVSLPAHAAISGSLLTKGFTNAGNSTGTTASITPTANDLILLTVNARTNLSQVTNQPTVTGNSLTWVLVNDAFYDSGAPSEKRVSVFRAMGSSPTTGGVTIDYGGQAQTDINWVVSQFSGMDTSGSNGSGAIVQTTSTIDQSASTSTLSVTLQALGSTNNAMFIGAAADGAGGQLLNYGAGFTGLGTASSSNMAGSAEEYAINKTSGSVTWNTNAMMGDVAVEIKAAVAVTGRRRQTMIAN